MSTETWKAIPTHPAYVISDLGNIQRVKRVTKARPTATRKDRQGYLVVTLWTNGRMFTCFVHRLLLETFVGPPGPEQVARHLDGDNGNNALGNLAWGSSAENADDRIKHALASVGLEDKVLYGKQRAHVARAFLDQGNTSPSDVARELGYSSIREMSQALTPGYYKGQRRKARPEKNSVDRLAQK